MKISKQDKKLLISIIFIILVGKVCGLSEEILGKIITGFLSFEILANLNVSIERNGKRKWAIHLKFFTKTN